MSQEMTQHHFLPEAHQQEAIPNSTECMSKSLEDSSQLESDKQLIKSHPLFVLLELLFDKCERATRGEEVPSSATYDGEIQEFVRQHQTALNPIFIDNDEIDNLMLKAVQVLRIHLLELEKVNELCKDFCNRYITCLKGKMHSENLLRTDSGTYPETTSQHRIMHNNTSQCMANIPNSNVTVNHEGEFIPQGGMYQLPPSEDQSMRGENGIDGSTPLSQVGVITSPVQQHMHGCQQPPLYHMHNHTTPGGIDEGGSRKTSKRGVLPKHATEILRAWLFSHIVHPYPTEDEKRNLATQTNLTLLQVNNWFINARRRILQPMLDASNHDISGSSKSKKTKMQAARPTERFWPNNIGSTATAQNVDDPERHASAHTGSHVAHHSSLPADDYGDLPTALDPPNQLRHYEQADVSATSCAQGTLSMVKN